MTALKVLVILPILLIGLADSQCNQCLTNRVLCIDDKRFVFCVGNGITTTKIEECGEDQVCTGRDGICLQRSAQTPPACPTPPDQARHCSQCSRDHNNNFACLNDNTFSRCNAEGRPVFSLSGSCPDGMVCNIGYEAMCVNKAFYKPSCFTIEETTPPPTTQPPTTPPPTTPPPTTPPPTTPPPTTQPPTTQNPITTLSPSAQCAAHNAAGIYPVGSECSRYLVCSVNGGQLSGKEYACPDTTFFNPATKKCVISRPQGCPAVTTPTPTTILPNALSSIPTTVTTVNPATQFCAEKPALGRFPFNNSCKQYLVCSRTNGQLNGNVESCPDGSFYNHNSARCSIVQQPGCVV